MKDIKSNLVAEGGTELERGMDVWDYLDSGAGEEFEQWAMNAGANLTDKYVPDLICNIDTNGDLHQKVWAWIKDNRAIGQSRCVRPRDYHVHETKMVCGMPRTVGYSDETTHYAQWDQPQEMLRELIGGREAFEKMRMQYERSVCRLIIYPPGTCSPYHVDSMQNWRDANKDINPHLVCWEERTEKGLTDEESKKLSQTDIGPLRRRILQITPWHWGHIVQLKNTVISEWTPGDVWDSAPAVWHLVANVGVMPRISVTITGVETV